MGSSIKKANLRSFLLWSKMTCLGEISLHFAWPDLEIPAGSLLFQKHPLLGGRCRVELASAKIFFPSCLDVHLETCHNPHKTNHCHRMTPSPKGYNPSADHPADSWHILSVLSRSKRLWPLWSGTTASVGPPRSAGPTQTLATGSRHTANTYGEGCGMITDKAWTQEVQYWWL